jgi:hypothetical protein
METIEPVGHSDIAEPNLRKQRQQLCLRQSAGDSTRPQVDIASAGAAADIHHRRTRRHRDPMRIRHACERRRGISG